MSKVARNDITKDKIKTKVNSEAYRENAERLWGKSRLEKKLEEEQKEDAKTN